MSKIIQLGLVGLSWGEQTALAINQIQEAELISCFSRTPTTREDFARRYKCKPCSSLNDMLSDDSLDGVIFITPNKSHLDQVHAAAQAKKHVHLTKPMATTIQDCKKMIEACNNAQVILSIGHQSRKEQPIRRLKELIENGTLGKPVLVETNISTDGGQSIKPGEWRWSRDECPGGVLIQLGIHHIDTLQYLFGPISQVQGWQQNKHIAAPIDDVTFTYLEFESGLTGYLGSTYASAEACWIRVYGTKLNALYEQLAGLFLCKDSWEAGINHNLVVPPESFTAPLSSVVAEVREFVDCIRNDQNPEVDGWQGMRNVAVVVAAIYSNSTKQVVSIDDFIERESTII